MPAPQYIGLELIEKAVKKIKGYDGISVSTGTQTVFASSGEPGELINEFLEWANDQLDTNSADANIYEIKFKSERKRGNLANFHFAFNAPQIAGAQYGNNGKPVSPVYERLEELGKLKAENEHLQTKVAELTNELMEYQQAEEETEEIGNVDLMNQIGQQLIPVIPTLIDKIISGIGSKNSLAVNGMPDGESEVNQLVNVLLQNGVTVDHLRKLANMATNDKLKFKSLLMML